MQVRDQRYHKLKGPAQEAAAQKQRVLSEGGYSPILHTVYRDALPGLVAKYDGHTARDALTIYMYTHAYVNGTDTNDWYMWAFPDVEQIRKDTGIHRDRIAPLVKILEAEGLLVTEKVPWMGNSKKMYLPLYHPMRSVSRMQDTVESR